MRLKHRWNVICSLLALLAVAPATAAEYAQPRIVNGELTGLYPTTGALLRGSSSATATAWCSGTLIGCQTFLTAAHCVDGLGPGSFQVFLPHAGFFGVASIARHPSFSFPNADVAVLRLAAPVDGVAPTPINTTASPSAGTAGVIAGYGRSGDPNYDYGLKRVGSVTTASCAGAPNGGNDSTLVCWNFNGPLGDPGSNSNTCNADSGGPLFVDFGAGKVVAGITSGGNNFSCQQNDFSYDANVYTYRTYIADQAGADLASTSCGSLPQVGSSGTNVVALTGTLSADNPDDVFAIDVPAETRALRVAMNGVDDGASDFDLYVRAGSPPTAETYDCRVITGTQYNFCAFDDPVAGPWYVMASRWSGAGTYQVTATTFGSDCSAPENDGQSCDDGNPCTTGDLCQAGSCTGTAAADGTPCDDGDGCTQPDTCQSAVCVGAEPTGCTLPLESAKAFFRLDDRTPNKRDKLQWRWRKGDATKASFGDPVSDTTYELCVYDEIAGAPALVLHQTLPAGAGWRANRRGFRYTDRKLARGGIKSASLKEGSDGRATISVNGQGAPLAMPNLPLQQDGQVTVRLLNGTACWEARYGSSLNNDGVRFKARAD